MPDEQTMPDEQAYPTAWEHLLADPFEECITDGPTSGGIPWKHLDEMMTFKAAKLRPPMPKIDRYTEQRKRKRVRTSWERLLDDAL